MDKAFIQGIVARYNKMESVEPGWDHYDLKHLWWLLDYHHNGFPEVFQICYDCKDWQGLNNFFYQRNRLDIFPTYVHIDNPSWQFFYALTAIAVGDVKSVEHLFPTDMDLKTHIRIRKGIYPLCRVGEILLAGIWYQDSTLLDYAVPRAEKYVGGKWAKWEIAAISYMLALQNHDVVKAGEHLENACKIMHTDFDVHEKKLFVSAHGLYQLAARVLTEDEFQKLSMPGYRTFSREYAQWRNSHFEPPQLFIHFPEPVSFIDDLLVADWRSVPWKGWDEFPFVGRIPASWLI